MKNKKEKFKEPNIKHKEISKHSKDNTNDNEIANFKVKKKLNPFKKFLIIIILIIILISLCLGGYKLYIFKTLASEMFNNTPSSVLDSDGNVVANIGEERNRDNVSFDNIPSNLVNAYISIEDQRYYSHHGVDVKRTAAAIASYVIKRGSSSFGGSTITQQLVKNITGDDSASISRKVKEWFYAWCLEANFTKDEILEAYLNIIYTGPNIYGVSEASKYYFNKDLNDLSLAECAFLAGLNHSPNSYNPFTETDRSEKIKSRTKTVLNKMLEQNYISQDDYNTAVAEVENGLNFNKGNIQNSSNVYSYHTDGVISEVISDLASSKHIPQDFATNFFYMSGCTIYGTEKTSIQETLQKEMENSKYILKSSNGTDTSQAAMVIIDHSTGQVVACSGGLGNKTTSRSFNRVTQMKRQTGSAMKPIAVLAPAISKKLITNVSVFADEPTTFTDYNGESYSPTDYDDYKGSITLRQAVESSQNIPFVKIMEDLTPQVSIKYLKKMGITTLNDKDVNLSLSLGGLDEGISPLEFAGAYATIANDGIYIEPTFYTKVMCKSSDKIFMKTKQKSRRVLSKDVSYILKELLTEPVKGSSGTATYCAISGMDVAAKTGTTNENYDRWLCGFTTYYTSVCWYGFDMNETINFNGRNPAGLIWSSVMTKIHSNFEKTHFQMTKGVLTATICRDSGKVANSSCSNTYTEYFLKGTVPEECTMHSEKALINKSTTTQENRNTSTSTDSSSEANKSTNSSTEEKTTQTNTNKSSNSDETKTQKQTTTTNTNTNTNSGTSTNTSTKSNDSSKPSSGSTSSNTSTSTETESKSDSTDSDTTQTHDSP